MKNFLENLLSTQPGVHLSYTQVLLSIFSAFLLSRIIIFSYHRTVDEPLPPKDIANHITLICLVTTLIIIPISTNAILSLGMVGALSIVRFRTAIKSPTDTAFVYWSLAIGISLGAQFFMPAIVGTISIALMMEINKKLSTPSQEKYIINLEFDIKFEESIYENFKSNGKILSQVKRNNIIYLCLEVAKFDHAKAIQQIENVIQCEIISYKGDFIQ